MRKSICRYYQLFFAITFLFIFNSSVFAQHIWIGGASGTWNTAANWSTGTIPTSTSNVEFNSTCTVDLDFSGASTIINSLRVYNNSSVILQASATKTIFLSSTSNSPLGLDIEVSSALTLDVTTTGTTTNNSRISLTNNPGVTGLISGALNFTCSGGSTGGAARFETIRSPFVSNRYGKLTVSGTIHFLQNTGTADTNDTTFTMLDDARYIISDNANSFPRGDWKINSFCEATSPTATLGPVFVDSVYGNLIWNTSALTTSYGFNNNLFFNKVRLKGANGRSLRVKSGATATSFNLTVNDSLIINNGVTLETSGNTVTAPNGGILILKGHLVNNGLLTKTGASGTKDTIEFSGSSLQTISGSGQITNEVTVKINNTNGVSLNTPLILPFYLLLKEGKVFTTNTNLLTLSSTSNILSDNNLLYTNLPTASYNNYGTSSSYVVGPLKKNGLSSFSKFGFPVGSSLISRPLFLNNATGSFTVEYSTNNPRTLFGTSYGAGIDHVSSMEYWNITASGSPSAAVELSFYDPNSGGVTNIADLRVAKHDGSAWQDQGNFATIGTPGSDGSVTSNTIASFSPFTLASSTANNPLPAKDVSLSLLTGGSTAQLLWSVNADDDVAKYEVELSNDGVDFRYLSTVFSRLSPVRTSYQFLINDLNAIKLYFRVKVIFNNNQFFYSNIVTKQTNAKKVITIYPNPVKKELNWQTNGEYNTIRIYNKMGNLIIDKSISAQQKTIFIPYLPKGIYTLQLSNTERELISTQFIKE